MTGREDEPAELAAAKKHVAEATALIARQRGLIAELESKGKDASEARSLLKVMIDLRRKMKLHRDRMKRQSSAFRTR